MVAIMHIKLADNAPGRMLHLFDIGIDGHRALGDDGTAELADRRPAAEPKNQYRYQRTAVANMLADAVVGPEPRQCILQPRPHLVGPRTVAHRNYCYRLVCEFQGIVSEFSNRVVASNLIRAGICEWRNGPGLHGSNFELLM